MENSGNKETLIVKDYDSIKKWSYSLAREWVINNLVPKGITSARLYEKYKREGGFLPKHFPRKIDEYFQRRELWKGWNDLFGNLSRLEKRKTADYELAKKIVNNAGIRKPEEYKNWHNRPKTLPAHPRFVYEEWKGWGDFLGKNYYLNSEVKSAKLKENEVRIIKHQLSLGVPAAQLAKMFGVSDMQVIRIKRGENWGHIKLGKE